MFRGTRENVLVLALAVLAPVALEVDIGTTAEVALGSGGFEGMGLGAGWMKMLYMPFAHTDFVFPMIGEELGLGGTLLVLACFALFAMAGLAIAQSAADRFGQVLGVGLTVMMAGQAILNVAVTTGSFPNTGLRQQTRVAGARAPWWTQEPPSAPLRPA